MSAIDPTCLPWQTKHDFDIEGRTTIIGNVDGEIIDGMTHNTFDFVCCTVDLDDDSQSRSIAVANADFIVRACNSHAALVAAADRGLVALEQELHDLLTSVCLLDDDLEPRRDTIEPAFEADAAELEQAIASVTAAIAKARRAQ